MSSVVLLQSPYIPPPPVYGTPGWERMILTWTGWDGSVWDLTHPDGGVFLTRGGVRGLGMPDKINHYRDENATIDGAYWRGLKYGPREVYWPTHLFNDASTREWTDFDRAFWKSLHPRREGVWSVTVPGVSTRTLRLRLTSDGSWAPEVDPTFFGWTDYPITLQADQPLWVGGTIAREFEGVGGTPFFGGTTAGDPIIVIGSGRTLSTASITNPGDEDAWPRWKVTGPSTMATVAVAGHTVEIPVTLADATKWISIDSDPTVQSIVDQDGNDVFESMGAIDFGAIPAGETVNLSLSMTGTGKIRVEFDPLYLRAW